MRTKRMSRVARKKKEKRVKILRGILRLFKWAIIEVLKNMGYLSFGIVYVAYSLLKWLHSLIGRLFLKLPRVCKVCVVYFLILGWVLAFATPVKTIVVERQQPQKSVSSFGGKVGIKPQPKEEPKKEENKCNLDDISCKIYYKAIEKGFSVEQAIMTIAISQHETNYYRSSICRNKNNFGGLYNGREKTFYKYDTVDEGINAYIS